MLFVQESLGLVKVISILEDWENAHQKGTPKRTGIRDVRKSEVRGASSGYKDKICYHCNRKGHTKKYCFDLQGKNGKNMIKRSNISNDISFDRYAKLNGCETKCLFDTGSFLNIITELGLKDLNNVKLVKLSNAMKITFLNNSSIMATKKVLLNVE